MFANENIIQSFLFAEHYVYFLFCSAEAYQSIVLLMGTQHLHARWHGSAKVNHLEWTENEASQVLEEWKREFTKVTAQCLVLALFDQSST